MYLELTVSDFFKSFESPRRISQFLAEGFATNNTFLVGAAAEELIDREEDAIIAVVIRGAAEGGHFKFDSPLAANLSLVLSTANGYHPILRAIDREMYRAPQDKLWVERAVASVIEPSRCFETDRELAEWFLGWLKDDGYFRSYQAPSPTPDLLSPSPTPNESIISVPNSGPIVPEVIDED